MKHCYTSASDPSPSFFFLIGQASFGSFASPKRNRGGQVDRTHLLPSTPAPRKECLGWILMYQENQGSTSFGFWFLTLLFSFGRMIGLIGEVEHEKIRLSVFQSPDSISVVVAKIIVKRRYPAIEPATLIEYAARLTSSKRKLRRWTSWTLGSQTLRRPPGDPDETNNDARRS